MTSTVVFWFIILYLEGFRVFHGENSSLLGLNVCVRGKQLLSTRHHDCRQCLL